MYNSLTLVILVGVLRAGKVILVVGSNNDGFCSLFLSFSLSFCLIYVTGALKIYINIMSEAKLKK